MKTDAIKIIRGRTERLVEQIDFIKRQLATREAAYPTRIAMKRITQKEADRNLALTRAVLYTLEKAKDAGAMVDVERFRILEPTLRQVHICARTHAKECVHCEAVANVMDDVMGVLDKK